MNTITKYDNACTALAECNKLDEVKDIRDQAEAMQIYARQAKDPQLIQYATEIRLRSERRCGQLLKEMTKNVGTAGMGRPSLGGSTALPPKDETPKLSDSNISKTQSSRWQKLARLLAL